MSTKAKYRLVRETWRSWDQERVQRLFFGRWWLTIYKSNYSQMALSYYMSKISQPEILEHN